MAKRSDFAQKLLDDIRVRKQRMAAGNKMQSTSGENFHRPHNRGARSETTANLGIVGQDKHRLLPGHSKQKQFLAEGVSRDIIPFEGRSSARQRHVSDISAVLAFALENISNPRRYDIQGNLTTNGQSVGLELDIWSRSFNPNRNHSRFSTEPRSPPAYSHLHLSDVARGAHKLNQILKTYCSTGLNLDRRSIEVGRELLKGAIDLEESLKMMVSLQEASEYMVSPKPKKKITLIQEDGEDGTQEEEQNAITMYDSQHKPGRQSNQSVLEFISRHPWATRDWVEREPARASSNAKMNTRNAQVPSDTNLGSSTPQEVGSHKLKQSGTQRGKGIPNVIAKLMGLEEFPRKTESKAHRTDNFSMGAKPENPLAQRALTHTTSKSAVVNYNGKNERSPSQPSEPSATKAKAPAVKPVTSTPSEYPRRNYPVLKENKNWLDSPRQSSKITEDTEAKSKFKNQRRLETGGHAPNNSPKLVSYYAVHDKRLEPEALSQQHGERNVQNKKEKSKFVRTKQQETRYGPESKRLETFNGKHQVAQQSGNSKPKAEDVNKDLLQKRSFISTHQKHATRSFIDGKRRENTQERINELQSRHIKYATSPKAPAKELATRCSTEQKPNHLKMIIEKENANYVPPVVLMKPITILHSSKSAERKHVHSPNKTRNTKEADSERIKFHFVQEEQKHLSVPGELKKKQEEVINLKEPDNNTPSSNPFSEKNELCRLEPRQPLECSVEVDGSMQQKTFPSNATLNDTVSNIGETRLTKEKPSEEHASTNQEYQKKNQAKESRDYDTNESSCSSRQLWKAISTDCKGEYLLTEEECRLKQMLLASEKFLTAAEALFKLQIPVDILYATYQINQDEDSKLLTDSAYEIMKQKGKREELLVGLTITASSQWSKIKCLDDLMKELYKDLNVLMLYSKCEGDEYDAARHLHGILKKDIENKDADVNTMWTFDWNSSTFACQEKDEVIRDAEKHLLNRLVDEITKELLQLGMSRKKKLIATRD